jgi:hypothetical protein
MHYLRALEPAQFRHIAFERGKFMGPREAMNLVANRYYLPLAERDLVSWPSLHASLQAIARGQRHPQRKKRFLSRGKKVVEKKVSIDDRMRALELMAFMPAKEDFTVIKEVLEAALRKKNKDAAHLVTACIGPLYFNAELMDKQQRVDMAYLVLRVSASESRKFPVLGSSMIEIAYKQLAPHLPFQLNFARKPLRDQQRQLKVMAQRMKPFQHTPKRESALLKALKQKVNDVLAKKEVDGMEVLDSTLNYYQTFKKMAEDHEKVFRVASDSFLKEKASQEVDLPSKVKWNFKGYAQGWENILDALEAAGKEIRKAAKKGKFDTIYADRWQLRIEQIKNAVYFVEPEPLPTGEDSTQLPSV